MSAPVRADIVGSIWENQPGPASDATPANVPNTPADVTFSIPGGDINFTSGRGYTIGAFLASGGATITNGVGEAGNTLNNTIFNITGEVTVTTGETFTAGHDDGLTFIVGGFTLIDVPGPTSFQETTETYNGPFGLLIFSWCTESLTVRLPTSK